MMKVVLLALAVVACFAVNANSQRFGGKKELNPEDPKLMQLLQHTLTMANADDDVTEIESATAQMVNGVKFVVVYKNKEDQTCTASWIHRPWVSRSPIDFTVKCVKDNSNSEE